MELLQLIGTIKDPAVVVAMTFVVVNQGKVARSLAAAWSEIRALREWRVARDAAETTRRELEGKNS